uniref:Uncharacterized protein n=1 Tax=Oryza rufipogon TaxID=4529 RepID=A0A0E0PC12_ORYRU
MEPRDYRVNSIKSLVAGPLQCHATIPWAVGPAFWSYGIIAVMRFHPAGWVYLYKSFPCRRAGAPPFPLRGMIEL